MCTLRAPVLISSSSLLTSGQPCLLLSTPTLPKSTFIGIAICKAIGPSRASPVQHVELSSPHYCHSTSCGSSRLSCVLGSGCSCLRCGREVTPRRAKGPQGRSAYPKRQSYGLNMTKRKDYLALGEAVARRLPGSRYNPS